jgi:hypothetical protein
VQTFLIETDLPGFDYSLFYSDDGTPSRTQCTGDPHEYGASGVWEQDPIPNTDPALGAHYVFEPHCVIAYGPPTQDVSFAATRAEEALNPLLFAVSSYDPDPTAVASGRSGDEPGEKSPMIVCPNPAGAFVEIRLSRQVRSIVNVGLYDSRGRLLRNLLGSGRSDGVQSVRLDLSGVPAGVYFVRARAASGETTTERVVRLR